MTDIIIESLLDALKDGALSIPILFLAYLLMELLEHSGRLNEGILHSYSRKAGPALGGLLGAVPQCGISGAAATLFSTGTISVGTMLAVFFATSDEMLPVMLASLTEGRGLTLGAIAAIVGAKVVMGVALGYLVDAIAKAFFGGQKDISSFCQRENCDCDDEGSPWKSALVHTLKIALMLIAVNFALNLILTAVGAERLGGTVLAMPVLGELLLALIGLVPNCSISVIITQGFLSGIIGLGGLFAGLLSNAGIGLLVLFRTNKNMKENLAIVGILFALSAVSGMLINLIGIAI